MKHTITFKVPFVALLITLIAFPSRAQWGVMDSAAALTRGECDDSHPAIQHNAEFSSFADEFSQWLAFERTTPESSFIAAQRVPIESPMLDTSIMIIASGSSTEGLTLPDVATTRYRSDPSNPEVNMTVAAWQSRSNGVANIWYSFYSDSSSNWSAPVRLTNDSIDNTNVQVRPSTESNFLVAWTRGKSILCAFVSPTAVSAAETVGVTTVDTIQFDVSTFSYWISPFVWSDLDTAGRRVAIYRFRGMSTWNDPETLQISPEVFNPHLVVSWYGPQTISFESNVYGDKEVYWWSSRDWSDAVNISNDPASDDVNGRAFSTTAITLNRRTRSYPAWPSEIPFTFEKSGYESQSLLFSAFGGVDTIRNSPPRQDRNAIIGSRLFPYKSELAVQTVWESNRSGRSHIYGRRLSVPFGLVKEEGVVPTSYTLEQNFPNPFNPTTEIRFSIERRAFVSLKIYDLLGREVETLCAEELDAGSYRASWNGSPFAAGAYLYRLETNGSSYARRMMLLK